MDTRTEKEIKVEKDLKSEKEKIEKEVEKEALLAHSMFTGGHIRLMHISGPGGGEVGVSHEYIGIGPLLVPCTRGEQKAKSGDVLIEVIIPDPNDPLLDKIFIFLLPREVAEVFQSELVDAPPVSALDYQKFQDDRARRLNPRPVQPIADKTPAKALSK